MKIDSLQENGVCRLSFEGEMNIYRASEIKELISGYLGGECAIEADLSGVTEMDSSGLQLLLLMKNESRREGKGFAITAKSEPVSSVISLFRMDGYFSQTEA